ncbi:hypothetical protein ACIPIN_08140 [Pseudomonas sp. NPDC087697]|uniref:hypothetical protein n=1 Tax=Pseudomonas sp. NPDC087697 TaxID=3364447 RepID=UPI00380610F8
MRLTVELVKAADDLPPRDPALQAEFNNFSSTLSAANIKYSQRAIAFDGGGALGYPLGQFILDFTSAIEPILTAAAAGWFYSRKGRKVRMKLDNGVELETSSPEEMRKLVEMYEAVREGLPLQSDKDSTNPDSRW